jgi:hypothetical protein
MWRVRASHLATEDSPHNRMPGWPATSWAYHGDDGKTFHDSYRGNTYINQEYGEDDTIGCLYDLEKKEMR